MAPPSPGGGRGGDLAEEGGGPFAASRVADARIPRPLA